MTSQEGGRGVTGKDRTQQDTVDFLNMGTHMPLFGITHFACCSSSSFQMITAFPSAAQRSAHMLNDPLASFHQRKGKNEPCSYTLDSPEKAADQKRTNMFTQVRSTFTSFFCYEFKNNKKKSTAQTINSPPGKPAHLQRIWRIEHKPGSQVQKII